jgi:malonyl-CoA O-methyltransferase
LKIDKELILNRFETSFEGYNNHADVQRRICARLDELLPKGETYKGMELGAGTGFLTTHLVRRWPRAEWFVNDLSPAAERFLAPIFNGGERNEPHSAANRHFLWGDAEAIPYPAELDLIASASTVQWFEDMPKFIAKAAAALAPEGILALSSFGPENFREMKPAGLDYLSLDELTALIQHAGLKIIHAEEWSETLRFQNPHAVLRYIKTLGLNALSTKSYTKGFDVAQLTYHPLIIIAKKS